MRNLTRPKLTLPTLASSGLGGKQADHNRRQAKQPNPVFKFPAHWNKPDVRGALFAMHGPCCAFCQAELTRGDRGDVEHYRPKGEVTESPSHGGYWWLAYHFENFLLSCRACNANTKRNHFPLLEGGVHVTYENRKDLDQEQPLLLESGKDNVESLMCLNPEDELLSIQPVQGLTISEKQRVEKTITIFGLNTNRRLYKMRRRLIDKTLIAVEEGKHERVKRSASCYEPGSWIIRQLLSYKNWHELLPSPEQEFHWFLESLLDDVNATLRLLQRSPQVEKLKNDLRELFWSLAVLKHRPPAGDTEKVTTFLQENGLLEKIQQVTAELK